MIGHIYRLIDTKRIEMVQREIDFCEEMAIVKLDYMAICAADQRYYLGRRKKATLSAKLPMALIHEATGIVLRDMRGKLQAGANVVMIPLMLSGVIQLAKENYSEDNRFASSGTDGFMRDIIAIPHNRIVPIHEEYSIVYVFSEILSVALGAINEFEACCRTNKNTFGVWGDGSMGYIMALSLRCKYPSASIYVFGKTIRKLHKFSFATKTYSIDQVPDGLRVDHSFECVGNMGAEAAISQMVEMISPQGCISLLGVSETPVAINTRKILEKGLRLIGNSRSNFADFQDAVALIQSNILCRQYLRMLVSEIIEVRKEEDILHAFDQDVLNDFKTVIKWRM